MEYLIPSDNQVRLLSQFVDSMWLGGLYRTYQRMEKENQTTPRQMLKLLIYAYMNQIYSTRRMEEACRRDIKFMWLLEGKQVPDHTTFTRFRNLHFAPCAQELMGKWQSFCTARRRYPVKAYSLNVYKYLKYFLEHLPETPMSVACLDKLAPWNRDVKESCSGAME